MVRTDNYDLDVDTSLGGNSASDYVIPSQKAIKTYVDNNSGGGTATDVQINGTSITSSNIANIITNSAYNALSNKIATMTDVPTVNNATLTIQKNGTTVETFTANASSNVIANITVPTTASDISAANTDLSNLTTTGKTVISGQWVQSTQTIIENTSITNSNGTALQKTVTLPDDNYVYEVLFQGRVQTGTSSGNNLTLSIKSNVQTDNFVWICAAITRSSSYFGSNGNVIIPMKHGTNNLSIGRASSYNGTAWLYVLAYRRLGTNL